MKKVYESTAAHTLFLYLDVNPRVSIKLCRNKHTPYSHTRTPTDTK